ncbi:hypothetical protein [Flammeovirga sp. EKP202]|uniref:hypothetical protein n=1 Tax=Flammeovirga sp. EKP202 TaxID=2770592 RepID=UPI00165F588B|nr:hypothetical protein [Flammeovirga sp. EKP202]MBD0405161.1 hypothetical protein [Flammeovirga sp. EKP202]
MIFEFEADFAPFQLAEQKAVIGVPLYHFSNQFDGVASNEHLNSSYKPIQGAYYVEDDPDEKKGHSISDFFDKISKLPVGSYKIVNGEIIRQ